MLCLHALIMCVKKELSYKILQYFQKCWGIRPKAGMTQRDLAEEMGRDQNFVWRIENGERRLDVVEFFWVCQALGADSGQP